VPASLSVSAALTDAEAIHAGAVRAISDLGVSRRELAQAKSWLDGLVHLLEATDRLNKTGWRNAYRYAAEAREELDHALTARPEDAKALKAIRDAAAVLEGAVKTEAK